MPRGDADLLEGVCPVSEPTTARHVAEPTTGGVKPPRASLVTSIVGGVLADATASVVGQAT